MLPARMPTGCATCLVVGLARESTGTLPLFSSSPVIDDCGVTTRTRNRRCRCCRDLSERKLDNSTLYPVLIPTAGQKANKFLHVQKPYQLTLFPILVMRRGQLALVRRATSFLHVQKTVSAYPISYFGHEERAAHPGTKS